MAKEADNVRRPLEDIVKELGCYPLEAFDFLHRGLDYTVQGTHGPLDPAIAKLLKWLDAQGVDLVDLRHLEEDDTVPPTIRAFLDSHGGAEAMLQKLNRHVGGETLCWGLRDFALEQWGLMASVVLKHWGIRSTMDFGKMVFALVENSHLQKRPDDRIEDFEGVYDFDVVFDGSFKITLMKSGKEAHDAE